MTAYTSLLNEDIGMSLTVITEYYAITYLPWMWKPLFAWISDNLPIGGLHRKPYILISAAGSATSYVITAVLVRSVAGIFAATFCRAICNAFLQLMVGAFLVDVARDDVRNSAALQSLVNAAKWLGTFVASCMALVVYAHGSAEEIIGARTAVGLTALGPALIAGLVLFMRESVVDASARATEEEAVDASERATEEEAVVDTEPAPVFKCASEDLRFAVTVGIIQLNLIVIGCQSLMPQKTWLRTLMIAALVSASILIVAYHRVVHRLCQRRGSEQKAPDGDEAATEKLQNPFSWVRLCVFCFSVNAIPSSSVAVGTLEFTALTPEAYQTLQIVGSLSSLCASLVFGSSFNRRALTCVFLGATSIAFIVGLAGLPFSIALSASDGKQPLDSQIGLWALASTVLGGIASLFMVLPVDTLVTSASGQLGSQRSATAYAILLSYYSFGATVGGLLASALLVPMGLDGCVNGSSCDALPEWVALTAFLKLLVFPLLLLIPRAFRREIPECKVNEGGEADSDAEDTD